MKQNLLTALLVTLLSVIHPAWTAEYTIDTKGGHAAINFSVSHLGYGWVVGRFNDFEGSFSFDPENPGESEVNVVINTESVDSNHAERDKHLRGADFLNTDKYDTAIFKSTHFSLNDDKTGSLAGKLTLHGVQKSVTIDVVMSDMGEDPWGGERIGFRGTTRLKLADFGIQHKLGPASETVDLNLYIEGVKNK